MSDPRLQTLLMAELGSTSTQAIFAQLAPLFPLEAYPAVSLLRLRSFRDQPQLIQSKV